MSGMLQPHDLVGSTFFIACNMMLAFTAFFFMQCHSMPKQWRASVCVAGIVTGIAFYNYTFMKAQWVETHNSPTVYRYADWLITVPLQIVEFYFILSAQNTCCKGLGMKLFACSLLMVACGWAGEIGSMTKVMGFCGGMFFWLYICYEVFAGKASECAERMTSCASKQAFNTLRMIVSLGWCIYPLGYFVSYIVMDGADAQAQMMLNILYNIADLVNKGAFGLCVYSAAASDKCSSMEQSML